MRKRKEQKGPAKGSRFENSHDWASGNETRGSRWGGTKKKGPRGGGGLSPELQLNS